VSTSKGAHTRARPQRSRPARAKRERLPQLDGIRAFAVITVLLYHFGVSWVNGGLLGVDVFFVLSGFLITTLLCNESTRTGTIALAKFWGRRARRLLPALFVLLIGVALYAHFYAGFVNVSRIRGDALSTLAYVANWRFIFSNQGYFAATGAPSPLLHTWSLAVEEQYYLIWPLVALVALRWRGARGVAWVAGIGALASATLMAVMHHAGVSVDRLYYGTDTRAQALLVGSFLGAMASMRSWHVVSERWAATRQGRVAGVALGVAGSGYLLWAWHAYAGTDSFLYSGGFLLVALAAGAVITQVVSWPDSLLSRFLSLGALTFIGRISYGLYLYHWPLFLVINNEHTGLSGFELLVARFGATFVVAVASYYLLEQPIRTRRFLPNWQALAGSAVAVVVTVTVLVVSTIAPAEGSVTVKGATMPVAERQQLTASAAFTTNPVRFLLLGDSVALTMGIGLSDHSKQHYGVTVNNVAPLGCDLDPNLMINTVGAVGIAPPGCKNWRAVWAKQVADYKPQVVGVELGRWEVADHLYKGTWTHIGQPLWDDHLTAELNQAVAILSAGGAKVVLFTFPYVDPPQESADGTPFTESLPSRADAYNKLVDQVGKAHPGVVTVVDLNKMLDPEGHYTATLDGDTIRWTDGVHVTIAGGELLQPKILPTVAALGLSAHLVSTADHKVP
jgi:peptidoglycan/LPS O-acetylase OafA/YrhL